MLNIFVIICILGLIMCGGVFASSGSLKAKHRLLMIGGGMILIGIIGVLLIVTN